MQTGKYVNGNLTSTSKPKWKRLKVLLDPLTADNKQIKQINFKNMTYCTFKVRTCNMPSFYFDGN